MSSHSVCAQRQLLSLDIVLGRICLADEYAAGDDHPPSQQDAHRGSERIAAFAPPCSNSLRQRALHQRAHQPSAAHPGLLPLSRPLGWVISTPTPFADAFCQLLPPWLFAQCSSRPSPLRSSPNVLTALFLSLAPSPSPPPCWYARSAAHAGRRGLARAASRARLRTPAPSSVLARNVPRPSSRRNRPNARLLPASQRTPGTRCLAARATARHRRPRRRAG